MITEKLDTMLKAAGYERLSTQLPEVCVYRKKKGETGYLLPVVSWKDGLLSRGQYEQFLHKSSSSLYLTGCREVHVMAWFLAESVDMVREVAGSEYPFWILATDMRRVIVYEDQPADFDQLRDRTELILEEREPAWWKRIPLITSLLVVINVLIFLIMVAGNPIMDTEYMMDYGAMHVIAVIRDHEYYRLFTSMFLHFDLSHIFNNMLILYFAGEQLEKQLGPLRFLLLYLLSGLCGNLLSLYVGIVNYDMAVSAGASGAVYGVIGGLLAIVLLHRGRVRQITGRRMLLLLVGSLYYGFSETGIDHMAHLGGAVSGVLLGFMLHYTLKNRKKNRGGVGL